jgi:hypothetical protein
VRIELVFKRNTAYLSGLESVRNITFVPNSSIQLNGTSTVCLGRKLSMVESEGPSTLLLNVNLVTHSRIYCVALSVFIWVEHHLFVKVPNSCERKRHCFSFKKTINVRTKMV